MKTTPNWLKQRAFLTPNRIAIETETEKVTFAELHEQVIKKANQLHTHIEKQQIIAVLMKNSIDMVITIHALWYLEAIVLLQNTRLTESEWQWQWENSEISTIIVDKKLSIDHSLTEIVSSTLEEEDTTCEVVNEFQLSAIATIMYTSGTTGKPKGVLQTFGNHFTSAIGSALNLGISEHDSWLVTLPFFHVSGLSILVRSVLYGMRVYLLEQFSAHIANEIIEQKNITIMSVVTSTLQSMLADLEEKTYPVTFRCMLLGGGSAPLPLLESCVEKDIPVFQTYGMTETSSQIVTLSPEYAIQKIGSAGKPLFFAELKIINNGKEAEPFEAGEIIVKGDSVTNGYLKNEQATKEAIQGGWFYTGDIGYVDDEGFLFVLDRRSDLIISGGENVYPAEIEAVLFAHESVKDVGVTGITDEKWGSVPIAFVVRAGDVTDTELLDYCALHLAKYKRPARIVFAHELPRNASNKLVRRELRDLSK